MKTKKSPLHKARERFLRVQNAKYSTDVLSEVPAEEYLGKEPPGFTTCFRSRQFLVQQYQAGEIIRLTVCRTVIEGDEWKAEITWDQLQWIKGQLGFADKYAIEVYPRAVDLVNVANMRHLWILPEPLQIGWFRKVSVQSSEPPQASTEGA